MAADAPPVADRALLAAEQVALELATGRVMTTARVAELARGWAVDGDPPGALVAAVWAEAGRRSASD